MLLRFAQFYGLDGTYGWVGVKEYLHNPGKNRLSAVVRFWLMHHSSELFTGAEDDDPPRHGPWPNRDRETVGLFREASVTEARDALLRWVRAQPDAETQQAVSAANEAKVLEILRTRLGDPEPDSVLLLDADADAALAVDGNDTGIGFMGGFVEVAWMRPSDGRFVVITATDD